MKAEHVLKKTLRSCLNKPLILVDKGPWCHDAMSSLGLKWRQITHGLRKRAETLLRTLRKQT